MTRRLLAASLGLTIVVLLVLVVPLGLSFADRERDDLLARVERDTVAVAFFVEDDLDPQAPDKGIDLRALADGYRGRTGGRVVIVDATGIALADSQPPTDADGVGRDFSSRPEIAQALRGEVARGTRDSDTLGSALAYVAVPVASGGDVDGVVRISYPTDEIDERVRRNWLVLGGLSIVTLTVAAGVAVVLSRSVTLPLRRLQKVAGDLGAGDLDARATTDVGPPEVRALGVAFNRMAAQLDELLAAQEQFVADASHELRTPLTALKLRLEMVDGGADTDAALDEVDRMTRLVESLLVLARADRPGPTERDEVDLGAFVEERRDLWEPLAADAGIDLVASAPVGATVTATRDRLAQIVDNLISNALDAAPEGSEVHLRCEATPRSVEIHVVDAGAGLTPDERNRAFDRFWRSNHAAGRFGGSGIGLAIVRKLAAADGAVVELLDADGGGVDAVVRYPLVATG